MKLSEKGLQNKKQWEQAGFALPAFAREAVKERTAKEPLWIHFGAGNIFRAFQANMVQKLLNEGKMDRGVIVAEGFDYEIVEKVLRPHEEYSILVTLKADGTMEKSVVGSITESVLLNAQDEKEFQRMKEIFRCTSLQMVSFTITEKGYSLYDGKGELLQAVKEDFERGPEKPCSYMGMTAALLYERFQAGEKPIAMVSMDNCSHNGDRLHEAMAAFARNWTERNLVEQGFASYINCPQKVSFPWTMIDKITPRPDASVQQALEEDGAEDMQIVVTARNTYTAPFVNAEECEYLVVEDAFPNGRPPLEHSGVFFTDRETVDKVEKMKVCTCLNPLHTALAVFGCLLGYQKISDEMKDPDLRLLVEKIGYEEGLPVVTHPGILDPKKFLDTVLYVRFPNPFMPDTPQRIATDTSQKLAVRFGETIRAYHASEHLHTEDLRLIPLVFAGWLRYLTGVDDRGETLTLSPDPLLERLCPLLAKAEFGKQEDAEALLKEILKDREIFGVDLYEAGMARNVCRYFEKMMEGPGAVRRVLREALKKPVCQH